VILLTENTQRYKSLAGFVIYADACDISSMRYALRGVKGFISYRTEHSEVYRNRVKSCNATHEVISHSHSEYIALQKKRGHFGYKTDLFSLSACYKGLGLARLRLTGQMRCLHFCQNVNSPLRTLPFSFSLFCWLSV